MSIFGKSAPENHPGSCAAEQVVEDVRLAIDVDTAMAFEGEPVCLGHVEVDSRPTRDGPARAEAGPGHDGEVAVPCVNVFAAW